MPTTKTYPGFVVSGTHSSVGKSSVAVGLMRLLKRKGFTVVPFKAGPDYIDPGHHERACGSQSYNLDSFMCTEKYIRALFSDRVDAGGVAVVEGMMGLFDGAHPKKDKGSTAEIARILGLPVLLVFDGQAMARSAAALVQGFVKFDPRVRFIGVIANRVNNAGHADILKQAIEHHTPVKFLGRLPQKAELTMQSRHLGLHQGFEQEDGLYDRWADHIEQHVKLPLLLKSLPKPEGKKQAATRIARRWKTAGRARAFTVAVARDEAFQFVYPDTLDLFRHAGGAVRFFSPLKDTALPAEIDWAYFPGGYPELHAKALSANRKLIGHIRRFAKNNGLIVGECGGLMYLGKSLVDGDGNKHPMAGVFDFSTTIENKRLTLGYRKLTFATGVRGSKPLVLKGHEFHFSQMDKNRETALMPQKMAAGNLPFGRVSQQKLFRLVLAHLLGLLSSVAAVCSENRRKRKAPSCGLI